MIETEKNSFAKQQILLPLVSTEETLGTSELRQAVKCPGSVDEE